MSKKKNSKVIYNDSLPIILADNLWLNVSKDRLCYLRFFMGLPEGIKEQARLFIMEKDLKSILADLCDHLNYFPEKKKLIKKASKKT